MTAPRSELKTNISWFDLLRNPATTLKTIEEHIQRKTLCVFELEISSFHKLPIQTAAIYGTFATVQYLWETMSKDSRFNAKKILNVHNLLDSLLEARGAAAQDTKKREYIAKLYIQHFPESETLPAAIVLGDYEKAAELLRQHPDWLSKKSSSERTLFNYALLGCQPRITQLLCKRYTNISTAGFDGILEIFLDYYPGEDDKESFSQFAHCLLPIAQLVGRLSSNSFGQLLQNAYLLAYQYRRATVHNVTKEITDLWTSSLKLSRELKETNSTLSHCFWRLMTWLPEQCESDDLQLICDETYFLLDDKPTSSLTAYQNIFLHLDHKLRSGEIKEITHPSAAILRKAEQILEQLEKNPIKDFKKRNEHISAISQFRSIHIARLFLKFGVALSPAVHPVEYTCRFVTWFLQDGTIEDVNNILSTFNLEEGILKSDNITDFVTSLLSYSEKHTTSVRLESKDEKQSVPSQVASTTNELLELFVKSYETRTKIFLNCFHDLVNQGKWGNILLILQHASKIGRAQVFPPNMLIDNTPLIIHATRAKANPVVSLLLQYADQIEGIDQLTVGCSTAPYTNCTVTYFAGLNGDLNLFKRLIDLKIPLYHPEFTPSTPPFLKSLILEAKKNPLERNNYYAIFKGIIELFPEEVQRNPDELNTLLNNSDFSYFAEHLTNQQQELECALDIFLTNQTFTKVLSGQKIINKKIILQEQGEIDLVALLLEKIETLRILIDPHTGTCPVSLTYYNKFMKWCAQCEKSRASYAKGSALISPVPTTSTDILDDINQFICTVKNIVDRQKSCAHVEPACTLVFEDREKPKPVPGDEKTSEPSTSPLSLLAQHSVLTPKRTDTALDATSLVTLAAGMTEKK